MVLLIAVTLGFHPGERDFFIDTWRKPLWSVGFPRVSIPANGIFLLIHPAGIVLDGLTWVCFHPGERDFFIDTCLPTVALVS